ncbi:MAG: hypothetical protein HC898_12385 [Phycisphaerales bacterium]|nr:hypothetical protein [Phycisphaerales bacterium]
MAVLLASQVLTGKGFAQETLGEYPVLTYQTHWLGNSFPGLGSHGEGQWVQNHMEALHVTPDGVAIAVTHWDEAGRCVGLYREGRTNNQVLKQYDGRGGAQGLGMGEPPSRCVAAVEDFIYVVNTEGTLLRFRWLSPDIDSARYDTQLEGVAKAHALDARGEHLVIVTHAGQVQVRNRRTLELQSSFTLVHARDVIITPQATLWMLVGDRIIQRSMSGESLSGEIADAGNLLRSRWHLMGDCLWRTMGLDSKYCFTSWGRTLGWSGHSVKRAGLPPANLGWWRMTSFGG